MILMFATFLCERIVSNILTSIDRLIELDPLNRFEVKNKNVVSFIASIQAAQEEPLQVIAMTSQRQLEKWTETLNSLLSRFDSRQQQEEDRWQSCLDALQNRHDAYDASREERVHQLISMVDARNAGHMSKLQAAVEKAMIFRTDVIELSRTLNNIARGEGRLVELQTTLTDNLRVLHETGQLYGAMGCNSSADSPQSANRVHAEQPERSAFRQSGVGRTLATC
jgi:hypothetical protein